MALPTPVDSLTSYYLKIQSLTPITEAASPPFPILTPPTFQIPVFSIAIFLGVLIVGSFALLLTKSHQINKMLILLAIALVTSVLPLGLRSLSQQTTYLSQANVPFPPKNVIVSQVSATSFLITWQTDKPETGALRLYPSRILTEGSGDRAQNHLLLVDQLKPGTEYTFIILSGTQWFDHQGQPIPVKTPLQ